MREDTLPAVVSDVASTLGEGPVWDASRQCVWWVDIEEGLLHCYRWPDGPCQTRSLGQRIGAAACCADGRLVVALQRGFYYFDPTAAKLTAIADPEAELPDNRFNDGKCDPQGRFWAGTMNLDPDRHRTGSLYALHADLAITRHADHIGISNGLAWTRDSRTMYYVDSQAGSIDAFDFDPEAGTVARRRPVFHVPRELGSADGMTIDADDRLWVAFWGGACVGRIDPVAGVLLGTCAIPASHVTSCTFGGPDYDLLFVTTARQGLSEAQLAAEPGAGRLFVLRPGVAGMPAALFRPA
jgi:sugar lactone lactonase YvrE